MTPAQIAARLVELADSFEWDENYDPETFLDDLRSLAKQALSEDPQTTAYEAALLETTAKGKAAKLWFGDLVVTADPAVPPKIAFILSNDRRNGWVVATREGDIITHRKLGSTDIETARRAAQEQLGPEYRVLVPALGEKA